MEINQLRSRAKYAVAGMATVYGIIGVSTILLKNGGEWLLVLFLVWLGALAYLLLAGKSNEWKAPTAFFVGATAPLLALLLFVFIVITGQYMPRINLHLEMR